MIAKVYPFWKDITTEEEAAFIAYMKLSERDQYHIDRQLNRLCGLKNMGIRSAFTLIVKLAMKIARDD
jgi:hypothetical protein